MKGILEIVSVVYRLVACCFHFSYCHSHNTIYKYESTTGADASASVDVSKDKVLHIVMKILLYDGETQRNDRPCMSIAIERMPKV